MNRPTERKPASQQAREINELGCLGVCDQPNKGSLHMAGLWRCLGRGVSSGFDFHIKTNKDTQSNEGMISSEATDCSS